MTNDFVNMLRNNTQKSQTTPFLTNKIKTNKKTNRQTDKLVLKGGTHDVQGTSKKWRTVRSSDKST